MMPGLRPTVTPPPMLAPTPGRMPSGSGETMSVPTMPSDGVEPGGAGQRDAVGRAHVDAAADLVADLDGAARVFAVRRVRPAMPLNVPPTTYSRDDSAVVSGAFGDLRLVLGRQRQRPAVGSRRASAAAARRPRRRRRAARRRAAAPRRRRVATGVGLRIGRRGRGGRQRDAARTRPRRRRRANRARQTPCSALRNLPRPHAPTQRRGCDMTSRSVSVGSRSTKPASSATHSAPSGADRQAVRLAAARAGRWCRPRRRRSPWRSDRPPTG